MKITPKPGVLYAVRSQRDISRDELARQMGVTPQTAYRVESGRVDPSPRFIAALMVLTGAPFESLFELIAEDAA
ncbi:helix-turn-helix transcriptional regulator [Nocardioides alcanivorans]|uniref:helix-turn-helix transcriptional regulator n=1 Tax=Nocardioides alcanivorans TaxID=2897352 RepID=UPI001F255CB1|nr:helix-turn-helix transcriptional regulator [Nocardioides alcanivorans]